MDELAARYADRAVRSVFIYTREAHPGENYRHHGAMEDKRRNARAFKEHSSVGRQILLDSLDGAAHRAYGCLPNMSWIVGRGGFVHYKSSWTAAADVADALEGVIDFQENRVKRGWIPFYSERSAWSVRDRDKFHQGLVRNGPQAVEDFEKLVKAQAGQRAAPSDDVAPRIPGSFYKTEAEEAKGKG